MILLIMNCLSQPREKKTEFALSMNDVFQDTTKGRKKQITDKENWCCVLPFKFTLNNTYNARLGTKVKMNSKKQTNFNTHRQKSC